jgi:hypothetical protein
MDGKVVSAIRIARRSSLLFRHALLYLPSRTSISGLAAYFGEIITWIVELMAVQVIHALGLRLGITLCWATEGQNKQLKPSPRIPLFRSSESENLLSSQYISLPVSDLISQG